MPLATICEESTPFEGMITLDESYFGPKRQRGKKSRGAAHKTIVFRIYKRNGAVCTQIVRNCSKATLQKIIKNKVSIKSILNSDGWPGYDGLVDLGYKKPYRINHSEHEFVRGNAHINEIEGFWAILKPL